MTAWGATVSEITVASSVISCTNNSTRTARTSFYWKNLYLWSCFSISACVPIDFFPANSCSSAGTGTLKSRQFFNGNCQTPMDTAGYAPAIAAYEEKRPNFNVPFCTFSFTQRLKVVIGTPMVLAHSDILG